MLGFFPKGGVVVGAGKGRWYARVASFVLVTSATMFLYAGIYKEVVPFFVDWTLFSVVTGCISVLIVCKIEGQRLFAPMPMLLYFSLLVYLGYRALPLDLSSFGTRKLIEATALGVPAFMMGHHIARAPSRLISFATATLVLSLFLAISVSGVAIVTGNITSTNSLFGAGYQLTGAFIAGSLLLAFPLLTGARWRAVAVAMVLAIVGLAFVGSVPSLVFLYLAYAFVASAALVLLRNKTFAWRSMTTAGFGILAILGISLVSQPPAAVYRAIWKAQVALMQADVEVPVVSQWLQHKQDVARATGENFRSILGGRVLLHPEEEVDNYVDRVDLMTAAFRGFIAAPLVGNGFGKFEYQGVRTEHNIFLELGYEVGLFGISIFGAFLVACIVPVIVNYSLGESVESRILCISIFGFFIFSISGQLVGGYFVGRILMFSCGLIVGLGSFLQSKESQGC